jgi:hypothetical protein
MESRFYRRQPSRYVIARATIRLDRRNFHAPQDSTRLSENRLVHSNRFVVAAAHFFLVMDV